MSDWPRQEDVDVLASLILLGGDDQRARNFAQTCVDAYCYRSRAEGIFIRVPSALMESLMDHARAAAGAPMPKFRKLRKA
jgi:hypothetical protein